MKGRTKNIKFKFCSKYFFVISFLVLAVFLAGCDGVVPSNTILSANFIITDWEQEGPGIPPEAVFTITNIEQTYYNYSEKWSNAYIYFEVENTGNVEIDYYKVWFTVTCEDGSKYYDWTNGSSVNVGSKLSDYTIINVAGKQAVSVEITDWELTNYDYTGEWGNYVYIYYEIENTGNLDIDYYKVWFTITCTDGSKYYDWANGLSVNVGNKLSDYTMKNVAGKQVESIIIKDWELNNWS